jgi:hypothetical protein
MIPSEEEKRFGVLYFVGKEKANAFERVAAAVHIVPQKQVVRIRREASILEEAEEVTILTVDISTDFYGGVQFQKWRLRHKYFPRFENKRLYLQLRQVHLFNRLRSSNGQKLFDYRIRVHFACAIWTHGEVYLRTTETTMVALCAWVRK